MVRAQRIDAVSNDEATRLVVGSVTTQDAGLTIEQWLAIRPRYANGQVLAHPFQSAQAFVQLTRACLLALQEIHSHGIVHCDIKADNICIPYSPYPFDPASGDPVTPDFEHLRLIDFAFSLDRDKPLLAPLPVDGCMPYQSPELRDALGKSRASNITSPLQLLTPQVDLYSLSVMLEGVFATGIVAKGAGALRATQAIEALVAAIQKVSSSSSRFKRFKYDDAHRDLLDRCDSISKLLADERDYLSFRLDTIASRPAVATPITPIVVPSSIVDPDDEQPDRPKRFSTWQILLGASAWVFLLAVMLIAAVIGIHTYTDHARKQAEIPLMRTKLHEAMAAYLHATAGMNGATAGPLQAQIETGNEFAPMMMVRCLEVTKQCIFQDDVVVDLDSSKQKTERKGAKIQDRDKASNATEILIPPGDAIRSANKNSPPRFKKQNTRNSLSRLAEEGDLVAISWLGNLARDDGDEEFKKTADAFFRRAAEGGYPYAMYVLGSSHFYGKNGTPKDANLAWHWMSKAAVAGFGSAACVLGDWSRNGVVGQQKNDAVAYGWYKKCADAGNYDGYLKSAYFNQLGIGVPEKNLPAAAKLYEKGATLGCTNCMFNLGWLYDNAPEGFSGNKSKAVEWYQRAAKYGQRDAIYALGRFHELGLAGYTASDTVARQWFAKSKDLGSAQGMGALGVFAETGRGGMPLDLKVALEWYEKSLAAGLESAKLDVDRIKAQIIANSPAVRLEAPNNAAKEVAVDAVEAAKDAAKDAVKKP